MRSFYGSSAKADSTQLNYGPEWWHYSYGDQEWALHTENVFALYGIVH
jgi:D-alanyl-D-alanine dipeptidase